MAIWRGMVARGAAPLLEEAARTVPAGTASVAQVDKGDVVRP